MIDVAHHAGVSIASVSKVLRGAPGVSSAMKERVNASVEALSYRPHRLARGMRGPMFTVGVMLSDIENPFFSLLIQGMVEVFGSQGYELQIAPATAGEESQNSVIDSLIDHQMDGLILIAPRGREEHLERIGEQVPMVVIGPHGPSEHYDTVSGDDELGSALIVDHLVSLGHRRIAFLTNEHPADRLNLPESARARGFEEAMGRHGLSDDLLFVPGVWSLEGGRDAARRILEASPRPTAVHAGADVAAFGILSYLWEEGVRIPEDVSVAGYDNSPMGSFTPISLTSVDQSGHEMGAIAAKLLLERIAGRSEPHNDVLTPRLIVRGTTSAPGAAIQSR
ncbi:hypothetical protein LK10_04210 [Sinomonas humi]|uniref:HTH lacI-type domain-containing protein n=1 Tax=Sinomonas humi TaxID=1338436 RepID=A0A0B2AMW3_9MICC|nr:hypothetical protein LK10_04210 [Sinomonas humi]